MATLIPWQGVRRCRQPTRCPWRGESAVTNRHSAGGSRHVWCLLIFSVDYCTFVPDKTRIHDFNKLRFTSSCSMRLIPYLTILPEGAHFRLFPFQLKIPIGMWSIYLHYWSMIHTHWPTYIGLCASVMKVNIPSPHCCLQKHGHSIWNLNVFLGLLHQTLQEVSGQIIFHVYVSVSGINTQELHTDSCVALWRTIHSLNLLPYPACCNIGQLP